MASTHVKRGFKLNKKTFIIVAFLIALSVGLWGSYTFIQSKQDAMNLIFQAHAMMNSKAPEMRQKGVEILENQSDSFALVVLTSTYRDKTHPLFNLEKALKTAKELQTVEPSKNIRLLIKDTEEQIAQIAQAAQAAPTASRPLHNNNERIR